MNPVPLTEYPEARTGATRRVMMNGGIVRHGATTTTMGPRGDAPPRHSRMMRTNTASPESGDPNDSNSNDRLVFSSTHSSSNNNGSTPSVKHFSQRRRFANDENSSLSSPGVPRVEQVRNDGEICSYDRSPTKPQRTYSLSLSSSGGGRGGGSGFNTRTSLRSSKEEEKARQFLQDVEDRKALNSLKAQTLRMADLPAQREGGNASGVDVVTATSIPPPPPLDDADATPRAPRRNPIPAALLLHSHRMSMPPPPPPTTTVTGTDVTSPVSTLSTSSRNLWRAASAAPQAAAEARSQMLLPPRRPLQERDDPVDPSYQQLLNLPASRYSTCTIAHRRLSQHGPDSPYAPRHHHHHHHARHHSTSHNDDSRYQATTVSPSSPTRMQQSPMSLLSVSSPISPMTDAASEISGFAPAPPSSVVPHPHRMLIQVAPGMQAFLRSSDETWKAITNDYYMPGLCMGCQRTLFVIQDAAYILCPTCHTVSPMEGTFIDKMNAGVGLGFTYEDLVRWQSEIMEETKRGQR